MKRKASKDDREGEGDAVFRATSQLSALRIEVKRLKRNLTEISSQLKSSRKQEEELALYVSTVRRAWSLLESDAFILIRGLGEEARAPDSKDGDIAYCLVSKSGTTLLPKNLLAKETISFNIDQWSTEEEIEAERLRLLSSLRKIPCDILKNEEDIYKSSEDSDLLQRVSFTKQILSRLLNLIRDTNNTKQTAYLTKWMDLKTIQDENLFLQGEIEKLQEEVINARAELYSKTYQLTRLHHRMDKSEEGIPSTGKVVRIESTQQHVESGSAEQSSSALVVKEPDQHRDDGQFEQIKVLERQIMESEAARTKAENALTEVLALKSVNGKDDHEETRRLEQAMDELTQRFQAKVSELSKEWEDAASRAVELQASFLRVEEHARVRIADVIATTEEALRSIQEEKSKAASALATAQAELSLLNDLKRQCEDYKALEATSRHEAGKAQSYARKLRDQRSKLETSLQESSAREEALLKTMAEGLDSASNEAAVVAAALKRAADIETQLKDAQANMTIMISKIEAISEQESGSRSQARRALKHHDEQLINHRRVKEENLQLLEQISSLQVKYGEALAKTELLQEESRKALLIAETHASRELMLRRDIHAEQSRFSEQRQSLLKAEGTVRALSMRLQDLEKDQGWSAGMIEALKQRCSDLSAQLEEERRQRYAKERQVDTTTKPNKDLGGGLISEDAAMLERALSMLQCSICKIRFKNVTLTRCYHLFCSECIDEAIRNRHRKCPACGEKFGQDDVKSIYFTH